MRIERLAGIALALFWLSPAAAEEADYDTAPDWLKKPTPQELMSVWPAEALKAGLTGAAKIRCMVTVRGVLYDCRVEREEPPNAGFGAAALALAPQLLMRPATRDGVPVESEVGIPVTFASPYPMAPDAQWGRGDNLEGQREIIAHPGWLDAPTLQDVVAAYPEKARAARAPGQVTLACVVAEAGVLDPCSAVTEAPRDLGFGKAARKLSAKFRAPPAGRDGASLKGAAVNIAVSFTPEMLDGKYPPSRQYWAEKPSAADLAASLPEAVRNSGFKEARATLVCSVAPQGRLSDCAAAEEAPSGRGSARRLCPSRPSTACRPGRPTACRSWA